MKSSSTESQRGKPLEAAGRTTASDLLGAKPPRAARPVSLAMRKYMLQLVSDGDVSAGVVFAVSGGADSLAMAVAGADLADRNGVNYCVAVVDHKMRPESSKEAARVADRLVDLGLRDVHVLAPSPHLAAAGGGVGPEEKARNIRYSLLSDLAETWAQQANLSRVEILLGHTMDDQAETVLLRLGQGASTGSLKAMAPLSPPVRNLHGTSVVRARPLLGVRRSDTEGFCRSLGLKWEVDPTNEVDGPWRTSSGAPLPRASIRHSVLPALRRALEQDPVPALSRVAAQAQEDEHAIGLCVRQAYEQSIHERSAGEALVVTVKITRLAEQPRAVRARVLANAWNRVAEQSWASTGATTRKMLSERHIDSLDDLLTTPKDSPTHPVGKVISLPGFTVAKRERETLTIWAEHPTDARLESTK